MLFTKLLVDLIAALILYILAYISFSKFKTFFAYNTTHPTTQCEYSLLITKGQNHRPNDTYIGATDTTHDSLSPQSPLSPLSSIMTTTPPSPPPILSTATPHQFESQAAYTEQQGSESPGKKRKMSHQSADEDKEKLDDHLDTTFDSDDTVRGSNKVDKHLEPAVMSGAPVAEELGDVMVDDHGYDFADLFSNDDDATHVSTPESQTTSSVFEEATEANDEIEAAELEAPEVYLADKLPRWNQPRKLTRSMSIDSHDQFQLKPSMRLWESLKQVISHKREWWKDRPAPDIYSEHDLVQDASSRQDRNPDRAIVQDTADRVLDAVPYFRKQAEIERNTKPNALYKTAICIDQERGLKFKLEEMMNLVAGYNDAWLTDSLMETIVHLEAPASKLIANGSRVWFCTDPMIQTWCAAIDPDMHQTKDDMEEMISEERKISCLPARDIPPDAESIVFFTNRSDTHWKTVYAYVTPDGIGVVSIKNSMGTSHQYGSIIDGHRGDDYESLRRLMICIAKDSPNQRFRDAVWATGWVGNEDCPQQSGANDCGIFSANAAIWLLWRGHVHPGKNTSYEFRAKQGKSLRRHYTITLKHYLDMTMIARETKPELARNGERRWSVSGERTDSGYVI